MSSIVVVQGVYRTFTENGRTTAVLRGIDFEVAEGEFLCIMGPSGSGKSTLLHLVSGLDQPTAGKVILAGRDLARASRDELTMTRRETVGHVFQFFNLMPSLSVTENIGLPLAIQGKRLRDEGERLGALMRRFSLTGRADAMPHQLSGGEMQRTSIARALAGGQPLLLCDEPTGNLSQSAGLDVMRTLREVCDRDRKTVLLVTHNPRDATFADRVLFLVDGRLAAGADLTGPGITVDQVHEALAALEI